MTSMIFQFRKYMYYKKNLEAYTFILSQYLTKSYGVYMYTRNTHATDANMHFTLFRRIYI